MNTLIVAEKPSVALRIAIALGDNQQKRLTQGGVSYFEIPSKEGTLYIAAAVGHLFTIRQSGSKQGYPVLDVEWAPSSEVNKASDYTKKYLDVFKRIAPECQSFINACDFDAEGTVIGTNVIKFAGGDLKNGKRMKFSTTTIPDLKGAFANLMPIDMNNYYAGEVRHMLDWLWGINLSRALTSALAGSRFMKPLSVGRVQGPTLAILAKRELEIQKFEPKPFWRIAALIQKIEFANARGDIFEGETAKKALDASNRGAEGAVVDDVEQNEQLSRPYPPFDLTSLQLEASRALRLDPSVTLATAQSLYERSYISYPRTASQKLPHTLGLPKIIGELAKNPNYEKLAGKLIEEKRFRPNEGMKSDEAHPAIYPTGVMPKNLTQIEAKLYDLIAKRFLACFAGYAKLMKMKVTARLGEEKFTANGTRIVERGWLDYYGYANVAEKMLPEFSKGAPASVEKVYMQELKTQPPRRYGKAALISELEKKALGTKATRAAIIDTLFRRGYIEGTSIQVTRFGLSVYKALNDNVNMIINEDTTKRLEEDMERISRGEMKEEQVIANGKEMLLQAIKLFDSNKDKIKEDMQEGLVQSEVILGKCPKDGGNLVIRKSRFGKNFVACSNYPKCTATFSLPQNALVVPTGKTCEHCNTPIVKVIRKGRGVFEMDLDMSCVTHKAWREKQEAKQLEAKTALEIKAEEKRIKKPRQKKVAKPKKAKAVKRRTTKKKGADDAGAIPV